jgi:bacillithiol biosynthesis cysteine-adding enzyme BshC
VRPLAGEYAFTFNQVAPLYAGDPQSRTAWRDAAARVQAHPRSRQELAGCLAVQQARRDAPPAAQEAAASLTHPDTVAIVTGQQAGAFGGPLFTLHKAITALQLARRTRTSLEVPAVAVFWVDAEDHDWKEVASCSVLDPEYQVRTVTLPAPAGASELPVAALRLTDGVARTLDELQAGLAQTEFTAWLLEGLRTAYRPGHGMADAFARWLETLLGPHGLVVFDSSDVDVKPLLRGVFAKEIAWPGHTADLAARAGELMRSRGHAPQVIPQPDSVALFHLDGQRRPIRRHADGFAIGDAAVSADALAREVTAHPERFSPNVLLRPIAQDTLFPTICYVAGPSELAYLGQLRDIYAHFGVPMPLVHPRATATLVDAATQRFFRKYDVSLQDLQQQDESALNRLLQSQIPSSVEDALSEAEAAIHRSMHRVIDAIPAIDPTLAGAARTTLGKMEHELKGLKGKMIQAAKKRDETLRRQFVRAQAQTFPHGHPQERVLGFVHFLNLYGPALIDRLLEELPLDLGHHWVLSI